MLYLFLALALVIGVTIFLIKKGKIKDSDGDLIPDVIEDKVEDIIEDVEEKVQDIKKDIELKVKQIKDDVVDHLGEVKEDLGEIVKEAVAKPTKRRGRPAAKKSNGKGGRVENKPTTSGDGAAVLKNEK